MLTQTFSSKPAQHQSLQKTQSAETGFPSPATDHMEARLNLHEYLVQRPASTFFSRVKGDGDNTLGVFDGDLLVVDRSLAPRHKSLVVAVVEGEFRICRLLYSKQWLLQIGSGKRIAINFEDDDRCVIWGLVTHIVHSCV